MRRRSLVVQAAVCLVVLPQVVVLAGCPPEPVEPLPAVDGGDAAEEPGATPDPASSDATTATVEPPPEPIGCAADEPSCQRLEAALALVRAEVDQAQRLTVYGPEHPEVQAGVAELAALSARDAELAARGWPLDLDDLRLLLERELAGERLAAELVAAQRLPQHPDLVARRARLERLQQRLDGVAAGSWP
jgi:hypothetical protein